MSTKTQFNELLATLDGLKLNHTFTFNLNHTFNHTTTTTPYYCQFTDVDYLKDMITNTAFTGVKDFVDTPQAGTYTSEVGWLPDDGNLLYKIEITDFELDPNNLENPLDITFYKHGPEGEQVVEKYENVVPALYSDNLVHIISGITINNWTGNYNLMYDPYSKNFLYSLGNSLENSVTIAKHVMVPANAGDADDIRRKIYTGEIEIEQAPKKPLDEKEKGELTLIQELVAQGYSYLAGTSNYELFAFKNKPTLMEAITSNDQKGTFKGWVDSQKFISSKALSLGHKIAGQFTPLANGIYSSYKLPQTEEEQFIASLGFIQLDKQ